jgi:hypothetical protein
MLLHQFKYEEKARKKEMLFENGIYLTNRFIKDFQILLFQINSFYVEVYVDREEEEIGYMRAFSNTDDLQPYLDKIDISGLV